VADIRWLEVSMTVDGELAEAVAEVMGRYTTEGVVMEQAVRFNDAEDEGTPFGPIRVYGYIEYEANIDQKKQDLEEALWHLGQITKLPDVTYRGVEDQDWMAAWKKHYRPIPIGEKILILPAWLETSDTSRVAVKIDPNMAFGTGTHPTTQLCLALTEKYVQPGQPVIDVGCGSGILSIAAILLGASRAVGVDIDQAAIRSTRENAIANGVLDKIDTGVGSVGDLLRGQYFLRRAPLILANILAPVIVRLFGDGLADLVASDGHIILSGIMQEQSNEVELEAESQGLTLKEKLHNGDWVALAYHKS
jgi:ribosomal protein L11 methyltransferase